MDIAVIGTSIKENEKRVPIHPHRISVISEPLRKALYFERGYGEPFGVSDGEIEALTERKLLPREELMRFPAVIITKPVKQDFVQMQNGATVWGWIHSVQQRDITQLGIEKQLTLVAWENMHIDSSRSRMHIFYKNNEMAGYCGVQHALQMRGIDGNFGPARTVSILSMGSVSRGAIYSLKGHGFYDITVYTRRPLFAASNKMPGVRHKQILWDGKSEFKAVSLLKEKTLLIDELTHSDIIVNGMLQDSLNPVIFIQQEDIKQFKKQCLIIDISCDTGMGFSFAHPTEFENPVRHFGNITYYAVDHTPTLLWDSASWEISGGLLPFLSDFATQKPNEVLDKATDMRDGKILNPDVIAYQRRAPEYPYPEMDGVDQ